MFVLSLLAMAGSIYFIIETLKTSEPYLTAVNKVQASKEVQKIIGAPITPAWWLTGNVSTEGTTGKAELDIPVAGAKSKGNVYVKAHKQNNKWKVEQLAFIPEGGGAVVDLFQPPPAKPAPEQARQTPPAAPPQETPPPEKEQVPGGKTALPPGAAAGKEVKGTAADKKAPPVALASAVAPAPVPAVSQPATPPPAVPTAVEKAPAAKEKRAAPKPKKKYVKKQVPQSSYSPGTIKGETLTELGRIRITAGDYQGAVNVLSTAIEKYPGQSINYRLRGNAYDNMGRREQAIGDWKRAALLGDTIIQSYLLFLGVEWP
jgi:tetratricopeptide (TPR) repeat protein